MNDIIAKKNQRSHKSLPQKIKHKGIGHDLREVHDSFTF